jgi:hypothetical protein
MGPAIRADATEPPIQPFDAGDKDFQDWLPCGGRAVFLDR